METISKVHNRNLVRWAEDKPNVIVLSADLTSSCEIDLFKKTYPQRFFSFGIAEQNMLSWAGGLSREGFIPFVHTFAVFICRRAYDQVAMSIAYPNLPVKLFGFLPGLTTAGGATHQALEDIALMRSLPNMTVLECGDATEVESVLDAAYAVPGPVYIRMLRGEIKRLFNKNNPLCLGEPRILTHGNDIALFSSGICTEQAMRINCVLARQGVSIQHLHLSTLKPFYEQPILAAISQCHYGVITMENHTVVGGLGTCVAEILAKHGIGKKLIKIGIQDTFMHGASVAHLQKEYEIDSMTLLKRIEDLLGKKFNINEEEIECAPLSVPSDTSKINSDAL